MRCVAFPSSLPRTKLKPPNQNAKLHLYKNLSLKAEGGLNPYEKKAKIYYMLLREKLRQQQSAGTHGSFDRERPRGGCVALEVCVVEKGNFLPRRLLAHCVVE